MRIGSILGSAFNLFSKPQPVPDIEETRPIAKATTAVLSIWQDQGHLPDQSAELLANHVKNYALEVAGHTMYQRLGLEAFQPTDRNIAALRQIAEDLKDPESENHAELLALVEQHTDPDHLVALTQKTGPQLPVLAL